MVMEPRVTFDQLKALGLRSVTYARALPAYEAGAGKVIRIGTADGKFYHVTGVRLSRTGGHVLIGNGMESLLLRMPSKLAVATRSVAVWGGLAVAISILVALLQPDPTADVGKRISQLTTIQHSLRELDGYVSDQRSALQRVANDLDKLERERIAISRAATIDREQLQAFLDIQSAQERQREWLSLGLSFVVGVLSSIAATLVLRFIRTRFRPAELPAQSGGA